MYDQLKKKEGKIKFKFEYMSFKLYFLCDIWHL